MKPLRVAAHVHSSWSYDGEWSLENLSRSMGKRGYDAVLMSEHDRGFDEGRWREYQAACDAAGASGALLVPGMEYSDPTNTVHVLVWGPGPFLGEGLTTERLIDRVRSERLPAVLAHPSRKNAWRRFDPAWRDALAGVEIWNRKTDGFRPSERGAALRREQDLPGWVGMDFHRRRQWFPLAMRFRDAALSPESLQEAALAGRCAAEAFGVRAEAFCVGLGAGLSRMAEFGRVTLRRAAAGLQ